MTVFSISDFTNKVSAALGITIQGKQELLPSVLVEKLSEKGIETIWQPIQNWNSFESGIVDWGIAEFLNLINFKNSDKIQILSDISYKRDEVVIYSEIDKVNFEDDYADRYKEEFFEPLDYILTKNETQVILIHHNGLIAFYL